MNNQAGAFTSAVLAMALVATLCLQGPLAQYTIAALAAMGVETYRGEVEAFVEFSATCRELGPLDAREDSCRNVHGSKDPACLGLTAAEGALRVKVDSVIRLRDQALKDLPFWMPHPAYRCAERQGGGFPYRDF